MRHLYANFQHLIFHFGSLFSNVFSIDNESFFKATPLIEISNLENTELYFNGQVFVLEKIRFGIFGLDRQ